MTPHCETCKCLEDKTLRHKHTQECARLRREWKTAWDEFMEREMPPKKKVNSTVRLSTAVNSHKVAALRCPGCAAGTPHEPYA